MRIDHILLTPFFKKTTNYIKFYLWFTLNESNHLIYTFTNFWKISNFSDSYWFLYTNKDYINSLRKF